MVFDKVQQIICSQFDLDPEIVKMDSTIEEFDADSMDVIDLVKSLEDEFEIEVPDEALVEIKNVGDIVRFIEDY